MVDLLDLDLLDEDVENFSKIGAPCVIEGCSLGGKVVIINQEEQEINFPRAICYLPGEIRYLLGLGDKEAQIVHGMKFRFAGFLHIGEKSDVNRQAKPADSQGAEGCLFV